MKIQLIAASAIAHMLKRYPWVAYLGLVEILFGYPQIGRAHV